MGNRTYTQGQIEIIPALTKEHADKITEKCTKAFGAWPEWKLVKPEWEPAYLTLKDVGNWDKITEWQEQIQLLVLYYREFDYHLVGQIIWEDEVQSGTLHVDSVKANPVLNTMELRVTCEPDWECKDFHQYPKIEQEGIIVYEN